MLAHKELAEILYDEEFWARVRKAIMSVMGPILMESFVEGSELATEAKPRRQRQKQELPLDPEAIQQAADQIMQTYQNEFWLRINQTQRDALRAAIQRSIENGTGLEGVIADIEPLFGEQRARAWAVTETTNMIGEGARATYGAAGMWGWEWRTVGDARVDPRCESKAGEQYPITTPFRSEHPGCRCWADPVLAAP